MGRKKGGLRIQTSRMSNFMGDSGDSGGQRTIKTVALSDLKGKTGVGEGV